MLMRLKVACASASRRRDTRGAYATFPFEGRHDAPLAKDDLASSSPTRLPVAVAVPVAVSRRRLPFSP